MSPGHTGREALVANGGTEYDSMRFLESALKDGPWGGAWRGQEPMAWTGGESSGRSGEQSSAQAVVLQHQVKGKNVPLDLATAEGHWCLRVIRLTENRCGVARGGQSTAGSHRPRPKRERSKSGRMNVPQREPRGAESSGQVALPGPASLTSGEGARGGA